MSEDCGHVCCPDPLDPLHRHSEVDEDCCYSGFDTLLGVANFDPYDEQAETGQGPPA